jgi:2C-methyl-D-erythritol 2,4-cyclodiphosphate synthase
VAGAALLEGVLGRLRAAGYAARAVDVTIVGARPRLGEERLVAMRAAIASLLRLDPAAVSVKASSGNLAGDEGAGRVISARAVASVVERPLQ